MCPGVNYGSADVTKFRREKFEFTEPSLSLLAVWDDVSIEAQSAWHAKASFLAPC